MSSDPFAMLGVPAEEAITWMAALAAGATVFALWNALLWRDPMAARAERLRQRERELMAGLTGPRRRKDPRRRISAVQFMQAVASRLHLLRNRSTGTIAERLARAGWRSKEGVVVFLFFKLCLPFVFGGAGVLLFRVLGLLALPPLAANLVPLAAVLVGFYAPDVFVKNAITKREKALQKGLPDALDLLVICAEAGLSLDVALSRVSREMAGSAVEVADEFGLTAVELSFLPERRKALENLGKRCQLASMQGVVNTLLQTEHYGTPLAHSLRVLSSEFREERMLKAEEKAAKLPAVLTVPLILFIMPALIIVLIGPGILRAIDGLSRI